MAKEPKSRTSVEIYKDTLESLQELQRKIQAEENQDYSRCEFASRIIEAGIATLKSKDI